MNINIQAECNECSWKGKFLNMILPDDKTDILHCPKCNSINIYYFEPYPLLVNIKDLEPDFMEALNELSEKPNKPTKQRF